MKRWLFLVAGLLFAVPAVAQVADGNSTTYKNQFQGSPVGGATSTDTTFKVLRLDSSGNLSTDDADRDRDNFNVWQNIINFQMQANAAAFMIDSSDAKPTYDMRRLALVFYPQLDSLTTTVRIAVQVRGHYNTSADSSSAFPWYRWPVRNTTVAADQDSIGHIVDGTSAPPWTSGTGAWSGEFIVVLDVARQTGGFGAYPKGIYVPLVDHTGGWFWAPYTSVRVRYLNGIKSRMPLRVDMVGGSL